MKRLMLTIGTLAALAGLSVNAEEPYLAENLAVWLRADKGLTTNAVGGVTAWANCGTMGDVLDMALPADADSSAAHIAYKANGMGGKPSLSFDGGTYLKAIGSSDLGATSAGGAWFVVCKTSQTQAERGNKAIFGGASGNRRLGLFFPSGTGNVRGFFFNQTGTGDMAVEEGKTQIYSLTQWATNNASTGYLTRNDVTGDRLSSASTPTALNLRIGGQMLDWTGNFVGDIAEIRIYNRSLTRREHMAILFELCARYGVSYSIIDNEGLSWCGNSAQLGYCEGYGLPEDIALSATAGGATVAFDETPNPTAWTYSYLAHNGGNRLGRVWYFFLPGAARALPMTFTFDRTEVHVGANPSLYYKSSYGGAWTKMDATVSESDGNISFTLPAGAWTAGFFAVLNDLDRNLAMWHRADMGITTNAVGGVTAWANCGTMGDVLDMALPADADSSAAHIAYKANGMGGKPSLSFDGGTYLKAIGSSDLGATSAGGAWFVVCKTSQTQAERGNKAIFGGASGNRRLGLFFPSGTGNVRGFFFNQTGTGDVAVEEDKTQICSLMQWATNNASSRYLTRNDVTGDRLSLSSSESTPTALNLRIGGQMLDWTGNFVGDIAEIRIYNRPLTRREHMAILFELCARYGVSYSIIDNEGLSWCGNSAQLGYCEGYGLPEDIAVSATAGGLTVAFDQMPNPTAWTYSYLAHNGGNGLGRVWYFFLPGAARALPMTFAVDPDVVGGRTALRLYYSSSSGGPWTRVDTCDSAVEGQYAFPFAANACQTGFYRVDRAKGLVLRIR